jgi:hypothetical protein
LLYQTEKKEGETGWTRLKTGAREGFVFGLCFLALCLMYQSIYIFTMYSGFFVRQHFWSFHWKERCKHLHATRPNFVNVYMNHDFGCQGFTPVSLASVCRFSPAAAWVEWWAKKVNVGRKQKKGVVPRFAYLDSKQDALNPTHRLVPNALNIETHADTDYNQNVGINHRQYLLSRRFRTAVPLNSG